jgi:hypothetical protein
MDNALANIKQFFGEQAAQWYQKYLARVQQMPGANRLFKRISSASDKEQLADCFSEIRFALIFAGLGFQVEIEPSGSKGPDLRISRDGRSAIVEIMRLRKVYPGPPELDLSSESPILPEYGNIPRDTRKAYEKILAKFPQVGDQQGIIAIWNDEEELEDGEVLTAVNNIRDDAIRQIIAVPRGLSFVLYGSKWIRAGDHKQLYCFPICYLTESHQIAWQKELDTSTVDELVECALAQGNDAVV